MSLVTSKKLTAYKNSYLYKLLRSYRVNSDHFHYVLTHYVPKSEENADAQSAISKLQNEQRKNTQPRYQPKPQAEKEQFSKAGWDSQDWGPNTKAPRIENEQKLPTTSHFETLPPVPKHSTHTEALNTRSSRINHNVMEPKTAVAKPRPTNKSTPMKKEQSENENFISQNRYDEKRQSKINRVEQKHNFTSETRLQKRQETIKSPETNERKTIPNDFLNLQATFETTEWLEQANKLKVELNANLDNMTVKTLKLLDLKDNSETYIPLNRRTLNLLQSVIIGQSKFIILIFADGTTLTIAPKAWLDQGAKATDLIKNKYHFAYHDLDLAQLVKSLKPICASEVNTPMYMQMWLKYIPIIPADDN